MIPNGNFIDSEEFLLSQWRQNGEAGTAAIYRVYVRYLTAVCSRYISNDEDVKDIMQEAFLKIFNSLHTFTYRGKGSFKGWLARIVLNETLKAVKNAGRQPFFETMTDNFDSPVDEPLTDGIPTEVIFEKIRQLPDGYRAVFNLYVIEGKSHKEIGKILGIKEKTSASQFCRAKAMLAQKLNEYRTINDL